MSAGTYHNRTRRSGSIPRKLLRERKPYLLPVYYAMLTSELAREGIHNSGSYRFADHIYANRARGRFGAGRLLDRVLLGLPSARAFRARYLFAKDEIRRLVAETERPLAIVAVPSGYARELFEMANELRAGDPAAYARVSWHGLDLDAELVAEMRARAAGAGHPMTFSAGDALEAASYPGRYDMLLSLGFTEFLPDELVERFFGVAHGVLAPGGRLVTSGMRRHRLSDYLLRNIGELHTHYRTVDELRALAGRAGFDVVRAYQDETGLQAMVIGVRR